MTPPLCSAGKTPFGVASSLPVKLRITVRDSDRSSAKQGDGSMRKTELYHHFIRILFCFEKIVFVLLGKEMTRMLPRFLDHKAHLGFRGK